MKPKNCSKSSYCVLVVDDRPDLRGEVVALLSTSEQFQVSGEADGAESALDLLAVKLPDLVLLDVSLERGNGLSLTRQMRSTYPDLPIVVLSLHGDELFAERALRAGADGYVLENGLREDLLKAFADVLNGKVYVSTSVHDRILHKLRGPDATSDDAGLHQLSNRELEIFNLFGQEFDSQSIAERLGLSVKTVETHRSHIKHKLGYKNNGQLAQRARRWVLHDGLAVTTQG